MKYLFLLGVVVLCLAGCRKESDKQKVIRIQGTLLQSSSNPVPVADYTLSFYQGGGNAIIMGTSSSMADITTNASGVFDCHFPLGSGYFIFIPTQNVAPLAASGDKNAGIHLEWTGLPARDTDLHTMYLYKKVHAAALQLLTDTALLPSDTIEVYSQTTAGAYYKVITGISIPAATATTFDTIADKVSSFYSLQDHAYNANISVVVTRHGVRQNPYYGSEPAGDEDSKTYLLSIQ